MLVDSHCHLDFPDFEGERDALIERARNAGVTKLLTISTRVRRFSEVLAIADRYSGVFCSVGTHPHNAAEEEDVTVEELLRLAENPRVVAIGECGLDYHYETSPRDIQEQGFRRHIEAARSSGLPLVIHARDADERMAAVLREEMGKGAFTAVLHCFSSGRELAKCGVELGFYISFSGILTFKNSAELRSIAAEMPVDRLLVETDAPYLAPPPHRGRRNEPSYVIETAKVLGDTVGVGFDQIAARTTENFHRLFTRVPRL